MCGKRCDRAPGTQFFCHALITRTQVQEAATEDLIDRLFDGSKVQFFSAFLSENRLSDAEVTQLKELVSQLKERT